MENVRLFMANLGLSVLGYVVIVVLSLLLVGLMSNMGVSFIGYENLTVLPRVVLWISVTFNIALLVFLGTRLNLLNTHIINYISIFGVTILLICMAYFWQYGRVFISLPFSMLITILDKVIKNNDFLIATILAFIPSSAIWLGMLYQSIKLK